MQKSILYCWHQFVVQQFTQETLNIVAYEFRQWLYEQATMSRLRKFPILYTGAKGELGKFRVCFYFCNKFGPSASNGVMQSHQPKTAKKKSVCILYKN